MDLRLMGLDAPLFHTLQHIMDAAADDSDKPVNAPSKNYVRDAKAMAATLTDVKDSVSRCRCCFHYGCRSFCRSFALAGDFEKADCVAGCRISANGTGRPESFCWRGTLGSDEGGGGAYLS